MFRLHILISIIISAVLIGGATWTRLSEPVEYTASLASYDNSDTPLTDELYTRDFVSPDREGGSNLASPTELSTTDVYARQIFSDFISLKNQNMATVPNLQSLGENYASSITNQSINSSRVTPTSISLGTDTEAEFHTYGQTFVALRRKYSGIVASRYGRLEQSEQATDLINFMANTSELYKDYAGELLAIKTPPSLAQAHLEIINIYLENAESLKLVGKTNTDPIEAYKGANRFFSNSRKENAVLIEIQQILLANGVTSNILI